VKSMLKLTLNYSSVVISTVLTPNLLNSVSSGLTNLSSLNIKSLMPLSNHGTLLSNKLSFQLLVSNSIYHPYRQLLIQDIQFLNSIPQLLNKELLSLLPLPLNLHQTIQVHLLLLHHYDE